MPEGRIMRALTTTRHRAFLYALQKSETYDEARIKRMIVRMSHYDLMRVINEFCLEVDMSLPYKKLLAAVTEQFTESNDVKGVL